MCWYLSHYYIFEHGFNLASSRKCVHMFPPFSETTVTASMLLSLETAVVMTTCVQAVHWDRVWQCCGRAVNWYWETTRVCIWNMSITIVNLTTFWLLLNVRPWCQSLMFITCLIYLILLCFLCAHNKKLQQRIWCLYWGDPTVLTVARLYSVEF